MQLRITDTTKLIIILLLTLSFKAKAQFITRNDIAVMGCEFIAGHANGWREEVLYHPNALFQHFPKLNRNFWDNRISWQNKKKLAGFQDANHTMKFINTISHIAAISITVGGGEKPSWKKILKKIVLNYAAYQAGFASSYYLIHKNKL